MMWRCHVCGDERPDEAVSVHKIVRYDFGATLIENVRYCNDRSACRRSAHLGLKALAALRAGKGTSS